MTLQPARVVRDGEPVALVQPENPPRAEAHVVRRELADAHERAAQLLREAHEQAAAIVQRARLQAEQLGQAEQQRAREQAREQLALQWAALRTREASADQLAADRIVALARILAERIVHEQLRVAPETIVSMAREAIAQFWRPEAITVRGCPDDIRVLGAHVQALGAGAAALQLQEDPQLPRGSLMLSTPNGSLQAEVALQLERLVEALHT